MDLLNTNFLFASLFWGSVGFGYWIYGKRQSSMTAMFGGVAMIAASCVVSGWLLMSVICLVIGIVVYHLLKRGS